MQEFVVGFPLDDQGRVALIHKTHPAWQAGRLNGIGGHVDPGETPDQAMRREGREETGVDVDCWEPVVSMTFPKARIVFYRARVAAAVLDAMRTTTEEEVEVMPLAAVADRPIIANLAWLLPLAAYTADTYDLIEVVAQVAEA